MLDGFRWFFCLPWRPPKTTRPLHVSPACNTGGTTSMDCSSPVGDVSTKNILFFTDLSRIAGAGVVSAVNHGIFLGGDGFPHAAVLRAIGCGWASFGMPLSMSASIDRRI